MKSGWFKMYRTIIDWEWFKEHDMTCFFIYCLCKANLSDKYWRGTLIKKGQAVISRPTVCSDLGIKDRRYRTIVSRLIKSGEILTQTSEKHTIVTIVNWERYQADLIEDAEEMRQATDQRTTNERPTNDNEIHEISNCVTDKSTLHLNSTAKVDVQHPIEIVPQTTNEQKLELFTDIEVVEVIPESPKKKVATKKKTLKGEDDDPRVDCEFIQKLYNDRCPSLPRCIKLNDKRKSKIRLRFAEMDYSYETLQSVFDKAESSPFLRGENDRQWKCDLQWLMENSENWVKVLEGRYERNKPTQQITPQTYGTPNAVTRPIAGGYVSQADRNAATSTRQKCDILNTLAECQRDFEAGNISEGIGLAQ